MSPRVCCSRSLHSLLKQFQQIEKLELEFFGLDPVIWNKPEPAVDFLFGHSHGIASSSGHNDPGHDDRPHFLWTISSDFVSIPFGVVLGVVSNAEFHIETPMLDCGDATL